MKFKGWRTFAIAVIGVLVGGYATIDNPDDPLAWSILVLSALMAGLRAITTTAPGKKY